MAEELVMTEQRKLLNLDMYKKLYLARVSEERIIVHYPNNKMKTPMHMSMGSEAIAVGVCQALTKEDQAFGTYRSHANYLAKTQDVDGFFSEMYGKDSSILKGKGGSMHLCCPEYGFAGSSAIVASAISVAVGAAFANKRAKNNRVIAVFFGDGATDEGTFWESMNIACLMKVPVLFICEDNGLAIQTKPETRCGYDSITDIVSKFNCNVFKAKTTDAEAIYNLTSEAIEKMHTNQRPCFLHLRYYRYLQHVGIDKDFHVGYRSQEEFEEWHKLDPIKVQREKLLALGCTDQELKSLEAEIERQIDESIAKADSAPICSEDEVYKGVFG